MPCAWLMMCMGVLSMGDESPLLSFPDGGALVEGVVEATTVDGDKADSTVRIVHVFVGDQGLVGQTFQMASTANPPEGNLPYVSPILKVSERVISEYRTDGGLANYSFPMFLAVSTPNRAPPTVDLFRNLSWPARQRMPAYGPGSLGSPRNLALAVQRVASAKNAARSLELLKQELRSADSYVAAWACRCLAKLAKEESSLLLLLQESIVDATLSVGGRMTIHQELFDLDETWRHSQRRLELFETIVESNFLDGEDSWVIGQLNLIAQHPRTEGFSQGLDALLPLIDRLSNNETVSDVGRARAIGVLRWLAPKQNRYADNSTAFALLIRTLKVSKYKLVRLEAARLLCYVFQLDNERLQLVKELCEVEQDPLVLQFLTEASEPPATKADP